MTTTFDPRMGSELAGYRILRLLGRGGMSVVYLAEEVGLSRRVALKVLAPELAADPRFRERFLRESRVAASLDHSHVIPIYQAGEADGLLYIAMRYVEGTELRTVLREEGRLGPERALDLLAQVASALDFAHARGLVHRDVKPGNILIAREGAGANREHVYLSDFGLTKQASSESGLTESRQFVGTAEYIAPEQIEHGGVGPWTDVYALGCVVFECLTGTPPFDRDSLMSLLWAHVQDPPPSASERSGELPAALDRVLTRALAKDPANRYGTCGALIEDARTALALRSRPPAVVPRRSRRRPFVISALAAAVAAAAALAFVGTRDGDGGPTTALARDGIQRLDATTGELEATVSFDGRVGPLAVADGAVWALDHERRAVWRVDPRTNTARSVASTPGDPASIAAGDGSVWIAQSAFATARTGTVAEVDPEGTGVARALAVPIDGSLPNVPALADVAVGDASHGRALWLASPAAVAVKRVTRSAGTTVASISTGLMSPLRIALGGGAVWSANPWAVVRIDPVRNVVSARVALPFTPADIAATDDAAWIANATGDSVWIVDGRTTRVVGAIGVGDQPVALAIRGRWLWVANRGDGTVSRVDTIARDVTHTTYVGGKPEHVAVGLGSVWVGVHADGGRDETYLREVAEITRRTERAISYLSQPLYRAFNRATSRGVAYIDPEVTRQLQRVGRDAVAELVELAPPERYRNDHARYVRGLRDLLALYSNITRYIEAHDADQIALTYGAMADVVQAMRADLSAGFRNVVPHTPLTGFEPNG